LSLALRTGGHRVLERASAEAALERMKIQWPDVIFLDLKLPGMDGLALARRGKAIPDARPIASVAVTAAPKRLAARRCGPWAARRSSSSPSTRANNPGQRLTALEDP
jgi:CheY-like chemotaxis protein